MLAFVVETRRRASACFASPGPADARLAETVLAERARRPIDQRLERGRLAHGEVGQDLAIDFDPGLAEAVDKSTVGEPVLARRGIDALYPERPEVPLVLLAVLVGPLHRAIDGGLGCPDRVLAPAVKALSELQRLLVLGVAGDAT